MQSQIPPLENTAEASGYDKVKPGMDWGRTELPRTASTKNNYDKAAAHFFEQVQRGQFIPKLTICLDGFMTKNYGC